MRMSMLASAAPVCIAAITTGHAAADVVYATEDPFGGPFGLIGFDVCSHQSVAMRFTPSATYTLDRVRPWFMANDFACKIVPVVTITLRNDRTTPEGSFPGETVLESWTFDVSACGWNPVLENLESVLHPALHEGVQYWLMAESNDPCGLDGVWNWAQPDSGVMSICNTHPSDPPGTCEWTPASTGAVAAVIVEGTPFITGDLNGDGVVDVFDLLLLLGEWGPCGICDDCAADLNGDCTVDVFDLLTLLGNWG
jgi:hypothetical protein